MGIKTYVNAVTAIMENERKQKAVDKLAATPLNYGILRDLINSAYAGVIIDLTLSDGTKLQIKREDSFDKLQRSYNEAF